MDEIKDNTHSGCDRWLLYMLMLHILF